MCKITFTIRVVKYRMSLLRRVTESSSLKTLKTKLDEVLSNLL